MTKINRNEDFTAWALKWIARVISTVFALFLAFMALGGLVQGEHKSTDPSKSAGLVIGAFLLAYLMAVVIAWFKEKPGGVLLLVLGLAAIVGFMVTEQASNYWVTLIIGAPFFVSGILFLLCWSRIQKAKSTAAQNANTNPI